LHPGCAIRFGSARLGKGQAHG